MFNAFSSDDDVLNIQGDALTVNNGKACVTISGSLELTKDKRGLKDALALKQAVDSVVAVLQAQSGLPDQIKREPDAKPGVIDNPFK